MSIRKVILLDPYNDKMIEQLSSFEEENNINDSNITKLLNKIRKISREKYFEQRKKSNEIEEILFVKEDSKIRDYCHIYGEKDRKICTVSFPRIDVRRRTIIPLIVSYTQNDLGIKETFIKVDPEDKSIIKDLDYLGYESLGENNGNIIYLKEQELEETKQRMI
ncbi:MAG: hypothetical protein IKE63_02165 [Bacilli bacterium]|nr:hypothetical protein [Bacilli bacterium]